MKKGDIVIHEGFKVKIVRGAPVRFGERRAVVRRLIDGKSYAVTLRHLKPLAPDGARVCPNCGHSPVFVTVCEKCGFDLRPATAKANH